MTGAGLRERRRAAREAWQDAVRDADDGWSVLDISLEPMVAAFDLEVRPGLELVAVVFTWDRDGEGRAVALRSEEAEALRAHGLPEDAADGDELDVSRIGDAVPLGDAVVGDGTPDSRLRASIAVRELLAVGERGHGRAWLDEEVVEAGVAEPTLPPADPAPPRWAEWQLTTSAGGPWAPVVDEVEQEVVVRFHTVCGRGGWVLRRHVDRFPDPDGYRFETESTVVAEAAGGFVP